MTRSLGAVRVLLHSAVPGMGVLAGLTAAAMTILPLGLEAGLFHGYYQTFPLVLETLLLLFAVPLGSGGCSTALALGARRRTLFWAVQGCGAFLTLLCLLLCGALGLFAALLGRSVPAFWPLASLSALAGYLVIAFILTILGTAGGLVLLRHRHLSAGLMVLFYLLDMALVVGQILFAPSSGVIWRTSPWPIPVALGLLLALGEAFLYQMLTRLTVR